MLNSFLTIITFALARLQLCSQEGVEDEGEREESESGDSKEDEDYWLSQEGWEDVSSAQQQQRCATFSQVS